MENSIRNMNDLAARIKQLEAEDAIKTEQVKVQLVIVKESLKPSSLIKSSLGAIAGSKEARSSALGTTAGLAAGWLARKLFTLNSKNFVRNILGYGIQAVTTNLVQKKLPGLTEKKARFY